MDQDHQKETKIGGMVNMGNIYTKTGDKGKTSLFDNIRVEKDDIRVESYGTVDELNSFIGLSKNYFKDEEIHDELFKIQNKLFVVAANLATEDSKNIKHRIKDDDIKWLESIVDKYMGQLKEATGFIVPGTNKKAGHLQVARTICRRAERRTISLSGVAEIDPILIKYLNRLSDALYAMARFSEDEEVDANFED